MCRYKVHWIIEGNEFTTDFLPVKESGYVWSIDNIFLIFETIYAFYNKNVWIEGHFGNPAGFAMFVVACFPFMYYI